MARCDEGRNKGALVNYFRLADFSRVVYFLPPDRFAAFRLHAPGAFSVQDGVYHVRRKERVLLNPLFEHVYRFLLCHCFSSMI